MGAFQSELAEVNAKVVNVLDLVSLAEPYHISFNLEIDSKSLLKLYNVQLDYDTTGIVDKIVDYMRLQHQVCKVDGFAIVGMMGFLTEEELLQVYSFAGYEHIELLLIETGLRNASHQEKVFIVDEDSCIIEL